MSIENQTIYTINAAQKRFLKGGMNVSKRRGIMSDALKYEFAQELGVVPKSASADNDYNFETASELGAYNSNRSKSVDWGSVSSRDCGNLVKMAIEKAEGSSKLENLTS
jgi:small acid-soluble spore protein F (minor alpha/beta-type SASP)